MKIDPHNYKQRYVKWKDSGCKLDATLVNSKLIVDYLNDMEMGYNVGSQKGARGYARLSNLKQRMVFIANMLDIHFNKKDLRKVTEKEIISLFHEMRNGKIKSKRTGKNYVSTADYVWVFKAFWHWYMKVSRKEGKAILDITADLDTSPVKEAEFVYFTEKQIRSILNICKYDYKIMGWFCYDSGIRAPTELMNIRVEDLEWDKKEKIYTLTIRDEISKTFGRKVKLMVCSKEIKSYLESKNLKEDDPIFNFVPRIANQYYRRIISKVLGKDAIKRTKGGETPDKFSLYDFRHNSACYWIPRYKNESGLKYRFGWKKDAMIYYYTKMLGHKDTIMKEDLLVDTTKTELEQQIQSEKSKRQLMEEELQSMAIQMKKLTKDLERRKLFDNKINRLIKENKNNL